MEVLSVTAPKVNSATNTKTLEFSMHEGTKASAMGLETSNPISPLISASISPDCPKMSNPANHTPSPPILPALNLSSLPNTPTSALNLDLSPPSKRPSSAENPRFPRERNLSMSSVLLTDTVPSTVSDARGGNLESTSQQDTSNKVEHPSSSPIHTDSSEESPMPEWTQALQHLASFCYNNTTNNKNTPDNCQRNCDETHISRSVLDPMTTFQAMLANMGQMLLNSQFPNLSPKSSKDGSQDVHSKDSEALSPHPDNSVPQYEPHNSLQLPTYSSTPPLPASYLNGPEPMYSAFKPPTSDISTSQSSLAFTASLLAMMAVQKPDDASTPLNPFLTPSLMSNALCSSTTTSIMTPSLPHPFASNLTQSPLNTTDSTSVKQFGPNLTDGRDLLYQLGQHLMAMATGATPMECLSKPSSEMGPPSTSGTNISGFGFPSSAFPFLPNSISTSMNAKFFPPLQTQGHAPFPDGAVSGSQDKRNSNFGGPLQSMGFEKNGPHLSASGTGLSGISMRGNQKYSAYYQHQRKQGFSLGVSGEFTNQNQNRRQATANPLSNPRYGGRRFRSGISGASPNTIGLDARGLQRLPSVRGSSNTGGGSIFPSFRGSSYKHSSGLSSGQIKSHGSADSNSTGAAGGSTSTATDSTATPNRLRDTALLCSCGKDFESLLVFTLHMKETGHKPKSDQSERDIPKLVRGQDMWINSETEQTREILRCMRCHQSFRNLPELTMHMMKTNHYSEIVYNDSGRLVFVNPDEPRRGSATFTGSTHNSPLKVPGCGIGGKRSSRASNSGQNSITGSTWSNGLQSPDSVDSHSTLDRQEHLPTISENNKDMGKYKDTNGTEVADSKLWRTTKLNKVRKTETSKLETTSDSLSGHSEDINVKQYDVPYQSPSIERSVSPEPPDLSKLSGSPASVSSNKITVPDIITNADSSTELQTKKFETSVLRQIESFVESSLQSSARGLSVKVETCSSNTSQISSPRSVSTEFGLNISATNSSVAHLSPAARKRTFSEANLSGHCSPASSLTDESEANFKRPPSTSPDKRASMSSPISTKVTSSSDSSQLSENPLSSLQKLVDTTHKPVHPTAAFSAPSSSTLFVSCSSSEHSSKPSSAMRFPCSLASSIVRTTTGSKAPSGLSVPTTAASYTQLISPSSEQDSITPALSALYAYVENSSSCQTQDARDEVSQSKESPSGHYAFHGATGTENRASPQTMNIPEQAMNPALQALYAAAMSTVAAQYMNPAFASNTRLSTPPDPFNLFKQVTLNLKKAFESSSMSPFSPRSEATNGWMKMIQMLGGFSNGPNWGEQQSSSETPEPPDTSSPTHRALLSPQHTPSTLSGDHRISADFFPCENETRNESPGANLSKSNKLDLPSSKSPSSGPGIGGSISTFRQSLSNVPATRYPPPTLSARPLGATNGPSGLMSTMITKKAKCHFCGKPFANKGQVRLHISKNKCPCLLQQSCHVAALAAAFGSESRALANNPPSSVAHSLAPSKSTGVNSSKNNSTLPSTGLPLPNFSPTHRPTHSNDSSEIPSALSLLKERFQNFDVMHQRQPNRSSSGLNVFDTNINTNTFNPAFNSFPHAVSGCDTRLANQFFPSVSHNSGLWNGGSVPSNPLSSAKLPANYSGVGGVGNAAANANHLAAMALLAQTLAQITSSQLPEPATGENMTESTTQVQNTAPTSLTPSTIDPRNPFSFMNPGNFNFDLLLSQMNFAKQLNHMNWNDQSLDRHPSNPTNMSAGH